MAKQDTMTKDIRKNIAEVFGRVPKYATGVGKLFLASGKEIFNIEMPYIGAMYETNQDLLKEVIIEHSNLRLQLSFKNLVSI